MNPKYLNALNLTFGPHRIRGLLSKIGSSKKIWDSSYSKLLSTGIQRDALDAIFARKKLVDPQKQWELLNKFGIELIAIENNDYPDLLKETPSPPLALYAKGNMALFNTPSLAIVGTRAPSSYGRSVLESIVRPLSSSGLTIISGLAQGIDALAHEATLKAEGSTIAVLGCGLHQVFPKLNQGLAKDIIKKKGLIISEYPLGTPPLKQHFPARNRIIAGLSLGVFVVESRQRGGSLITARQALEANREVFALPGSIQHPASEGTNGLIQQGAKLVSCAEDILNELSLSLNSYNIKDIFDKLSEEEKLVINALDVEPLHIDIITKQARLTTSRTNILITSLELKGIIKNMGGNVYTRIA